MRMPRSYHRLAVCLVALVVASSWLGPASSCFGFIWGEPLPQLPPNPQDPPPALLSLPPDKIEDPPPDGGGPPLDPPDILPGTVSNTPEPATLIAGLIGAGAVGLWGAWRRRKLA